MSDDFRDSLRLRQLDTSAVDPHIATVGDAIRNQVVIGADRRPLGRVADLLVNPEGTEVRYLEVELDRELLPGTENLSLRLPLEQIRLTEDRGCLVTPGLPSTEVSRPASEEGYGKSRGAKLISTWDKDYLAERLEKPGSAHWSFEDLAYRIIPTESEGAELENSGRPKFIFYHQSDPREYFASHPGEPIIAPPPPPPPPPSTDEF